MKIRGILWDKDGTLIDGFSAWIRRDVELVKRLALQISSAPLSAAQAAALEARTLEALGVKDGRVIPDGLLAHGTEKALLLALREVLADAFPVQDETDFIQRARVTLSELILAEGNAPALLRPHARETLTRCHALGLIQGLATSDSEARARCDMDDHGLSRFFSFWACGDTCVRPKPDPWMAQAFCSQNRLDPGEVCVIGDAPADMEMARGAGCIPVGVLGGVGGRGDLAGAARVCDELREVLAFIETGAG